MYDAMISDVVLPKLDGIAVLSCLRAEDNRTHVLMLTAHASPESSGKRHMNASKHA